MAKVLRKIIKIDEDLCNGCGQCVPSCAEGAIRIIDGKARLVADKYCDGLGACLGECPMGALSFEEREAEEFDEHAEVAGCSDQPSAPMHGGCPGSRMLDFRSEESTSRTDFPKLESELRQWPVKLNLVNPAAPYLQGADVVLAADCSAFAYASFHPDFLRGKALVIGCPKFDDIESYANKLTAMIDSSNIKSLTVVHMEVPCCSGLLWVARKAISDAQRDIPIEDITISLRGQVKNSSVA